MVVLQRLSDGETAGCYAFDVRWRYAADVGGYDCGSWGSLAHTVLVDMRVRLDRSEKPRRTCEVTVEAAGAER